MQVAIKSPNNSRNSSPFIPFHWALGVAMRDLWETFVQYRTKYYHGEGGV